MKARLLLLLLSATLVLRGLPTAPTVAYLRPIDYTISIMDVLREFEWHVNRVLEYCKDENSWAFGRFYINEARLRDDYRGGKSVGASTAKFAAQFLLAYVITGNLTYLKWAKKTVNYLHTHMLHPSGLPYERWNLTTNSPVDEDNSPMHGILLRLYFMLYTYTKNSTYVKWAYDYFEALYKYTINKTTWLPAFKVNYTSLKMMADWTSSYYVAIYTVEMSYLYRMTRNSTVRNVAFRLMNALWNLRNKTTNIPPGRFRHTGEVYPYAYMDTGGMLYFIHVLLDWYKLTKNATLLSMAEDLAKSLIKYFWIDSLDRWRYAVKSNGTPQYDYMRTYPLVRVWTLIRLSQLVGNDTYAEYALKTIEFVVGRYKLHNRYDEFETFSHNNTVSEWTHLRSTFFAQPLWFAFWLTKNVTYLDILLDMYRWWKENRKSEYGYWFGNSYGDKWIEACNIFFAMHYPPFVLELTKRLKRYVGCGIGDLAILSTDLLGFWYCDIRSLRLWVNVGKGDTAILMISAPEKPTKVKMGCSWRYEPKPTREAFERARGPCWYWDEERGVLYVKVWGLSPPEEVIADWTPTAYADPPSESEAQALSYVERPRRRDATWQLPTSEIAIMMVFLTTLLSVIIVGLLRKPQS